MPSPLQRIKELHPKLRHAGEWLARTFAGEATREFLSDASIKRRKYFCRFLFTLVFSALVALLVTQSDTKLATQDFPKAGEIAEKDVLAPLTADIEIRETRAGKREDIAKKVPPVFDYEDRAIETWLKSWEIAFRTIREEFYSTRKPKLGGEGFLDSVADRIEEITSQRLPANDLLFLHQKRFSPKIERAFLKMGEYLVGRFISPMNLFPAHYTTGIIVRQVTDELTETLVHDVSRIWSLDQAREYLSQLPRLLYEKRTADSERLIHAVGEVIVPNLKFNASATEKRISSMLAQNKPPLQVIRKGMPLAKRGERISETQAELFHAIQELLSPRAQLQRFGFVLAVTLVTFLAIFRFTPGRRGLWYLPLKDFLFFSTLLLLHLTVLKYLTPSLQAFFTAFQFPLGAQFFLPVSMGGLMIHLTIGKEVALAYTILTAILSGQLFEYSYFYALWVFIVSLTAIQTIRSCKQRTDLYISGAVSGAVSMIIALCFIGLQLLGNKSFSLMPIAIQGVGVFLSGMLSAILAGSLIPIFESLFGYTTSLKLLEVANFNHPLLHTLMLKAPGTYHHSIIVGSLAEIAADRVHANSLLARVSAYYHDIGKMTKPLYFIENQTPNNNPHDHLQPSMSAKILFSHVRNGVRLAKEYALGKQITDIIEQHHGTTLVTYFFNKAKKIEKKELDHVNEGEFRYPGPKPQTREAAIVMLADACEASTRSITEPTPAKIQAMVNSIINKRFLDGQFTDCDLTFKDLQVIEDAFTRTLVSLYHHRIEYPGQNRILGAPPAASGETAPRKSPASG